MRSEAVAMQAVELVIDRFFESKIKIIVLAVLSYAALC
jgi:hypothetical protein